MELVPNTGPRVVDVGNLLAPVRLLKLRFLVNLNRNVLKHSINDPNHVLLIPWWVEMRLPG